MTLKLKSYLPENNIIDWLNGISFFICIWFFIYPYPFFTELFCVLALIPLLGILFTIYRGNALTNELTTEDTDKNELPQKNNLPFSLASFILAIGIYRNFNCGNYYSLFTHAVIIFVFLSVLFFLAHRKFKGGLKQRLFIYVELLISVLLYSYAVTFGVNCLFDSSPPERFETRVITKDFRGGGEYARSYYVTIAPWKGHSSKEDLPVSEQEYELADNGDYIYVDVQKGLWDIPWFYRAPKK